MSVHPLSRRRFVGGALAASTIAFPALLHSQGLAGRDPFTLGVASGCPTPDGVVLWTRLAPDPLQGGGMGDAPMQVAWELASDEAFNRVVARGREQAIPQDAHSVRVELRGLQPASTYWYRFMAEGARSPAGRTRTAPAPGDVRPVRFAFASCQHYEEGFYGAYRDMAAQPLDLVVHLGDYVYETTRGTRPVRRHETGIPTGLVEFRNRYALYKADRDLQAAHAAFPWLVTWDDHEVANDYTNDLSPRTPEPERFLAIRAAAYQAWYEHMPVPASARPRAADAAIHGRYRFGQALDLFMLDGRQYRSRHVCLPGRSAATPVDCPDRQDPGRTFLGTPQEAWLARELALPGAQWTVLAQPTLFAEADRGVAPQHAYWMDGWDGYPAARRRLLDALAANRIRNPLVISGDVHAFWAADVHREAGAPVVATEFTGGSLTSAGPAAGRVTALMARNPHLRYGSGDRRGYAIMSVDARGCEVEFRAVDDTRDAASATRTLKRFTVADGAPGVHMDA